MPRLTAIKLRPTDRWAFMAAILLLILIAIFSGLLASPSRPELLSGPQNHLLFDGSRAFAVSTRSVYRPTLAPTLVVLRRFSSKNYPDAKKATNFSRLHSPAR
jgi:hypothetical protein